MQVPHTQYYSHNQNIRRVKTRHSGHRQIIAWFGHLFGATVRQEMSHYGQSEKKTSGFFWFRFVGGKRL